MAANVAEQNESAAVGVPACQAPPRATKQEAHLVAWSRSHAVDPTPMRTHRQVRDVQDRSVRQKMKGFPPRTTPLILTHTNTMM